MTEDNNKRSGPSVFLAGALLIIFMACVVVFTTQEQRRAQSEDFNELKQTLLKEYEGLYLPFYDIDLEIEQRDGFLIAGRDFKTRDSVESVEPKFIVIRPVKIGDSIKIMLSIARYDKFLDPDDYIDQLSFDSYRIKRFQTDFNNTIFGDISAISAQDVRDTFYQILKDKVNSLPFDDYREAYPLSYEAHIVFSTDQIVELITPLEQALSWGEIVDREDLFVENRELSSVSLRRVDSSEEVKVKMSPLDSINNDLSQLTEELSVNATQLFFNEGSVEDLLPYEDKGNYIEVKSKPKGNGLEVSYSDSRAVLPKFTLKLAEDRSYYYSDTNVMLDRMGALKLIEDCKSVIGVARDCQLELEQTLKESAMVEFSERMEESKRAAATQKVVEENDRKVAKLLSLSDVESKGEDGISKLSAVVDNFHVPDGFINLKSLSVEANDLHVGKYSDGIHRMLVVFLPESRARELRSGVANSLGQKQIRVQVELGSDGMTSSSAFRIFKDTMNEDLSSMNSLGEFSVAAADVVSHKMAKSYGIAEQTLDIGVDSAKVFKPHSEGPSHLSISSLMSGKAWGKQQAYAMTTSYVYYNGYILVVVVTAPSSELQWTREESAAWINDLLQVNEVSI